MKGLWKAVKMALWGALWLAVGLGVLVWVFSQKDPWAILTVVGQFEIRRS